MRLEYRINLIVLQIILLHLYQLRVLRNRKIKQFLSEHILLTLPIERLIELL